MINYAKVEVLARLPDPMEPPEMRAKIPILRGTIRNTVPDNLDFLRREFRDATDQFCFLPEGQGNLADQPTVVLAQILKVLNGSNDIKKIS